MPVHTRPITEGLTTIGTHEFLRPRFLHFWYVSSYVVIRFMFASTAIPREPQWTVTAFEWSAFRVMPR